jgi:hypothetical protein
MFQAFLHSITLCADPSSRSLAGIVGSSSARVMDVCLLLVLCVVTYRSLPLADYSSMRHTECGVSECGREASIMRRPWPTTSCGALGERLQYVNFLF